MPSGCRVYISGKALMPVLQLLLAVPYNKKFKQAKWHLKRFKGMDLYRRKDKKEHI